MLKALFNIFFILAPLQIFAQGNTDIHLFDLSIDQDGLKLINHKQITDRPGYDNQVHFSKDRYKLYYSSVNESGLTDLYEYDLITRNERQITTTFLSSEYSPTPTPDNKYVSCIRQGADGSQNLVKYPISGDGPATVLIDNHLVGYHIWLDQQRVLSFILNGDSNDMYVHDLKTGKETMLAKNIGRCFKHIPESESVSFVQLNKAEGSEIKSIDKSTLEIKNITKTIKDIQDYAWIGQDLMIMGDGSAVYLWRPATGWEKQLDLSDHKLNGITRMAFNPRSNQLAVVCDE